MDPSIKDTSGVSYEKWVSNLRIKDTGCCHGSTKGLEWLASLQIIDPTADGIRILEQFKGKYNESTNTYRFKIRRNADLLYGFYCPVSIKNIKMKYTLYGFDEETKTNIEVPHPENGIYTFRVPLPLCAMITGAISFEYTLKCKPHFEVPITLISGWLLMKERIKVPEFLPQEVEFANVLGTKKKLILECAPFGPYAAECGIVEDPLPHSGFFFVPEGGAPPDFTGISTGPRKNPNHWILKVVS